MNLTPHPAGIGPLDAASFTDQAAPSRDISVAAIVLLSALAVALTILGVVLLGAVMVGVWWLVSHIPVPAFVWHLLAVLGL
ncbi:MAG TPA: hypothetical protein VMB71_02700 [Acetobacteraceae bacterium]|nr:hypothetical protein [Acetobacteraceae bacterium]